MSVNFLYFLSFLLFALCAYFYGHKKLRAFLDERISDIAADLRNAENDKEKAQNVLSNLQRDIRTFEDSIHTQEQELEERIQAFMKQQHAQLNTFLTQKEAHHHALLASKRQMMCENLKSELLNEVLCDIESHFQNDPKAQEDFNKKSVELLKKVS